jgi:hypothetical protein
MRFASQDLSLKSEYPSVTAEFDAKYPHPVTYDGKIEEMDLNIHKYKFQSISTSIF